MGKIVDIKTGKESKNPNPFEYGPSIQYNYRSSRGLSNAPISESTGTGTMQLIKDDPDNTTYLNSLFPYTTSNLTINMGSDRLQVTMNKQDILGHFYATRWDIESGTDYDQFRGKTIDEIKRVDEPKKEISFYIKFHTKEKIKFQRFLFTEELMHLS